MKTLNGAPQAETNDYSHLYIEGIAQDVVDATNDKLREWAESRKCVRCKWHEYGDAKIDCDILERARYHNRGADNFSCAAFETK